MDAIRIASRTSSVPPVYSSSLLNFGFPYVRWPLHASDRMPFFRIMPPLLSFPGSSRVYHFWNRWNLFPWSQYASIVSPARSINSYRKVVGLDQHIFSSRCLFPVCAPSCNAPIAVTISFSIPFALSSKSPVHASLTFQYTDSALPPLGHSPP